MQLLSQSTNSLSFLRSCYSLGYTGDGCSEYLKRMLAILEKQLQSEAVGDQLNIVPDLLSFMLLVSSK